jgi:hypothetical protein
VASGGGFFNFSFFLDCPPRILGGFTWRPQKEPLISNSKIVLKEVKGYFRAISN